MAKAIREAQSAVQHGSEALKKAPAEALNAATELAMEVRDEALELVESAGEQVGDLSDKVADAIRKQPFQAVGVALGIGCVMGVIIARR